MSFTPVLIIIIYCFSHQVRIKTLNEALVIAKFRHKFEETNTWISEKIALLDMRNVEDGGIGSGLGTMTDSTTPPLWDVTTFFSMTSLTSLLWHYPPLLWHYPLYYDVTNPATMTLPPLLWHYPLYYVTAPATMTLPLYYNVTNLATMTLPPLLYHYPRYYDTTSATMPLSLYYNVTNLATMTLPPLL